MLANLTGVLLSAISVFQVHPGPGTAIVGDGALGRAGLTRYWVTQVPLAEKDALEAAHLVDEALYVTTAGGTMFAIEANVGLIRWGAKLTEPDYTIYKPYHIGTADGAGPTAILTTTQLYIVDRFSGRTIRNLSIAFAPGSPPVGSGGALFMGSANSHFYAIVWDTPGCVGPRELWKVVTGGPITATPALYDQDKLLFASQSGMVYSCYAADKAFDWAFRTGGAILGDPVAHASGVYVASSDRSLYKLDPVTGELLWRFRTPRPLPEGPVVAGHTVYQHCPGVGLIAVDADTGGEKWRDPQGRKFVAHSQGRAVVFAEDRALHLIDRESGRITDSLDGHGAVYAVTNVQHDAVYLLGRDGAILCARPKGLPYLQPERVSAARAQLNLPPIMGASEAEAEQREATGPGDPLANDPLRSRHDVVRE